METPNKENVGRLTGRTTIHEVQMLITNPDVGRNNYFVIYDDLTKPEEERESHLLNIVEIWNDTKGLMAKLQVLGTRPDRPFEMGSEVFLADEEEIKQLLGISNPPERSISLGTLLSYDYDVNLLVKNFGRIFITGKSGSGKSYTMGVLCEEFLKKGIPIVILDRHGEYGSLKVKSEDFKEEEEKPEELEEGFCPWCGEPVPKDAEVCELCGKDLSADILEPKEENQEAATPSLEKPTADSNQSIYVDNIIEFADLNINRGGDIDLEYLFSLDIKDIVAPRLCTIVNLRGLDLEVQEIIAGKLLKKLYDASTGRKIPPFYLFLDEAHLFAGKKKTDTCETVKLFSQEGRKFGANLVLGTQRPQLLDTTIRAQAGTWIVHNLSDVNDIKITIDSAEDISRENKGDISGLNKGQAIISGEAVKGLPIFVQVRKRKTQHGGIGFNPLDFLSEETVDGLKKRKERILGGKSADELEIGKTIFKEIVEPKSESEYVEIIAQLRAKLKETEDELAIWKNKCSELESGSSFSIDEDKEELLTQIKVWEEKYKYLKEKMETQTHVPEISQNEELLSLQNRTIELEAQLKKYRRKYADAISLAERSIAEIKSLEKKSKKN